MMLESMLGLWERELVFGLSLAERCGTGAGLTPDAWAHVNCDTHHTGCLGAGFSAAQKKAGLDKLAKTMREREREEARLLDQDRFEVVPSDSEEEEEEEYSFDKKGNKQYGPKTEYTVGGTVHAV